MQSDKPVLPATLRRRPLPVGEAKRRALALLLDLGRKARCEREIDAAAQRVAAIGSVAELDVRAEQLRLAYEPTGPCNDCGAPAEWRHWLGCPEDPKEN